MSDQPNVDTETLGETSNFMAWRADEPDGEKTYHLELGQVTVHFFEEEWEEFRSMMQELA